MPTVYIGENTTGTPEMHYSGVEDVRIYDQAPTSNYDALGLSLEYTTTDKFGVLIRCTGLSNLPVTSIISSALFSLYNTSNDTTETINIPIHRCLQPWTETGATHNTYDGTNSWNTPGALGADSDISSTQSGIFSAITTLSVYHNSDNDAQFVSDIQGFVDTTLSNNGHLVHQTSTNTYWRNYDDSEGVNGQRPYFTITYSLPSTSKASDVVKDIAKDIAQDIVWD